MAFFSHNHTTYPMMYWICSCLQHLLLDSYCHCHGHLGQPSHPRHAFFITFISVTWNIHNKMNHFNCSKAPSCHLGVEIQHIQSSVGLFFVCFSFCCCCLINFINSSTVKLVPFALATSSTTSVSQTVALKWVVVNPGRNAQSGVKGLKEESCVSDFVNYALFMHTANCIVSMRVAVHHD